jgi:uncharacterized membrane protein
VVKQNPSPFFSQVASANAGLTVTLVSGTPSINAVGVECKGGVLKKSWTTYNVLHLKIYADLLLLGLEFELAADIVRSAISPTWVDIG